MTHYEIHQEINGDMCKLLDHIYPNSWAGVNSDQKAKQFVTAGGARNHIKNMGFRRAKPVRISVTP